MSADTIWLESLQPLLQAIAPVHLILVRGVNPEREVQWLDALPVKAHIVATCTQAATPQHGWLLRLAAQRHQTCALYIGVARREPSCLPQLLLAAALCRTAWKLRHWPELEPPDPRDENRDAMHALRNALNAMVMTAAVLQESPALSMPLQQQLQLATQQSLDALDRIALTAFR
jgi:hypothetical protein